MKSMLRLGILGGFLSTFTWQVSAQQLNNQIFNLTPVSTWHYGITQQGNADVFGGCVFSNLFDNGFILRFIENDGEVQRITFNFRQEIFKPRDVYPSKIQVADKIVLVPGVAKSFNTLEFKTNGELSTQELYLNKDKPLSLTIEGKEFVFKLPGLKEALSSLKDCRPVPLAEPPMSDLAMPQKPKPDAPQPPEQSVFPAQEPSYETERMKQLAAKVDALRADIAAITFQGAGVTTAPDAAQGPDSLLPMPGIGAGAKQASKKPQNIIQEPIRYNLEDEVPQQVAARPEKSQEASDPWGIKKAAGLVQNNDTSSDVETEKTIVSRKPKTFNVDGAPRVSKPKVLYRERKVLGADKYEIMPETVEVKKQVQAKWQAKAGEPLQKVLARWARIAGVNLVWDTENNFVLPIDINSNAPFQETVAQALALYDDQSARPFGAMDFKPVSERGFETSARKPVETYQDTREWLALEGMDLRAVIEGWAAAEGIKVIWMAPQRFNLQETVKVQKGFANAIETALGQFSQNVLRPVAQLNTDPNNGDQVLLVRLSDQTS